MQPEVIVGLLSAGVGALAIAASTLRRTGRSKFSSRLAVTSKAARRVMRVA
jgi:hypothetical protein